MNTLILGGFSPPSLISIHVYTASLTRSRLLKHLTYSLIALFVLSLSPQFDRIGIAEAAPRSKRSSNRDQPKMAEDVRLAVLEFRDEAQLPPFERALLADSARGAALNTPFKVMTKENMMALLPPGQTLEDCVGECEVDIGRKLNAHYIMTGIVGRIDGDLSLLLRLYETTEGHLKGQATLSAISVSALQTKVSRAALRLLGKLTPSLPAIDARTRTLLLLQLSPKKAKVKVDGYVIETKRGRSVKEGILVPIKPGRHTVEASAPGFSTIRRRVNVLKDQPNQVDLRLKRAYTRAPCAGHRCNAELFVYTQPAGATIYLNGRSTGQKTKPSAHNPRLGSLALSVPAGKYWVSAKKEPFDDAERLIALKDRGMYNGFRSKPLVLKRKIGNISLTSSPKGAIVRMNGEVVGKTPFEKTRLAVRPYWIELIAEGYQSKEELVMIKSGRTWRKHWKLTSSTAELVVKVRYRGQVVPEASIWIDGQSKGVTDEDGQLRLKGIGAGDRHIEVRHPLYSPRDVTLALSAGRSTQKTIKLKGAFARLSVTLPPDVEGERVLWAGIDLGPPPLKEIRVPAGRHWLQVRPLKEGHQQPYRKRLTLDVGVHKTVSARFDAYRAQLVIKSSPSGARITLDDVEVGVTPYRGKHTTGVHTLKLTKADMPPLTKLIEITREGLEERVDFFGRTTVKVRCDPNRGEVILNGMEMGPSPQLLDVEPGFNQVGCTLWGVQVNEELTLDQGQQLTRELMIDSKLINSARKQGRGMRWTGKGMVIVGVLGVAASLALTLGPMASKMGDRDERSQRWLNAEGDQARSDLYRQWARADQEAMQYESWALWSMGVGTGLSLIGAGLWALSPTPVWTTPQEQK